MSESYCEFIEINKDGEFIGAMPKTRSWKKACRALAIHLYYFKNYTGHFCEKHYQKLQEWVLEDGK